MKSLFFSLLMMLAPLAHAIPGFEPIIAYGTKVALGGETWKSIVTIQSSSGRCTGLIIDAQTILTSAHCKPSEEVVIYNYQGSAIASSKTYPVGSYQWASHPDYDEGTDHDLAVLVVAEIPWTQGTSTPVTILNSSDDLSMLTWGGSVIHVGTGVNATKNPYDATLFFTHGTISGQTSYSLITNSTGGRVCRGDSGGPVFVKSNGKFRLIALHSVVLLTGANCGNEVTSTMIDQGHYDWFTKAAEQLKAALSL